MDTSFDMYVEDFNTSFSGSSLVYETTENQFINSTGTTISKEDLEIDTTRYIDDDVELSEKIFEKKSEFTQRTSTTGFIDALLPKSIPLIEGIGALEFIKELENLEYSKEVKEFYKGSRELVKKLNIL
jgi:hypothetical protein